MAEIDRVKGTLPYSSELFGIYQPLLGWKSKQTAERFERQAGPAFDAVGSKFLTSIAAPVQVALRDFTRGVEGRRRAVFEVENLAPVSLDRQGARVPSWVQSGTAQLLANGRGDEPPRDWAPS